MSSWTEATRPVVGGTSTRITRGARPGLRSCGLAVRDPPGAIAGTPGAVQAITERFAARALQAAENLRFDAALNNISPGVCFFDGQQPLIVCNRRYAEMYHLAPHQVRPGTTLREIVDHRFSAGSAPDMKPAEYLAWRQSLVVSNQASDTLTPSKDGRIFAIQHQPMPDGGWVGPHQDFAQPRTAPDGPPRATRTPPREVRQRRRGGEKRDGPFDPLFIDDLGHSLIQSRIEERLK